MDDISLKLYLDEQGLSTQTLSLTGTFQCNTTTPIHLDYINNKLIIIGNHTHFTKTATTHYDLTTLNRALTHINKLTKINTTTTYYHHDRHPKRPQTLPRRTRPLHLRPPP